MPSTKSLAVPYPAPSDTPDVPYWLQKLAERVDALLGKDSGWTAGTGFNSGSGWKETTSNYRLKNGLVTVHFRFERSGSDLVIGSNGNVGDDNVSTVPVEARTGYTVPVAGVVNAKTASGDAAGSYGWIGQINNGTLWILSSNNPNVTWGTGSSFYGSTTYLK